MSEWDHVRLQPLRIPAGWVVAYHQLMELDPDLAILDQLAATLFFSEDILQFTHPRLNRVVDVGWYPECDLANGQFRLVVHAGDFRGPRLHHYTTASRQELVAELEQVLATIEDYPKPILDYRG